MTLKSRGLGEIRRDAHVVGSTYGVTIDNEVDAYLLSPSPLVISLHAREFTFAVKNAAAALDEVRRCAGQPTRAEMKAKPRPKRLSGGWELLEVGTACTARLPGDKVDVLVSINDADQVLLMVGHHEWNVWSGKRLARLQFDGGPAQSVDAYGFANLVYVMLRKDADVAALRRAKKLTWGLPTGTYSAEVHDVSTALDAAISCTRSKRKAAQ
jgi:hypothetical protein